MRAAREVPGGGAERRAGGAEAQAQWGPRSAVPPSRQCRRAAGPSMSEKKQPVDLGLLEEDDEFEEFPAEGAEWAERGGREKRNGGRLWAAPSASRPRWAGPGRERGLRRAGLCRAVPCCAVPCRASESPAGTRPYPLHQRPVSPGPRCSESARSGRRGRASRQCCVIVRER